jgi:hypothetical protein
MQGGPKAKLTQAKELMLISLALMTMVSAWLVFGGYPSFSIPPWFLACIGFAWLNLTSIKGGAIQILASSLALSAVLNFMSAQVQIFGLRGFECCIPSPGSSQVSGNLLQRNNFGSLMVLALLGMLWFARSAYGKLQSQTWTWVFAICCTAYGMSAAQSLSRTTFVLTLNLFLLAWTWKLFAFKRLMLLLSMYIAGYSFGWGLQHVLDWPHSISFLERWTADGASSRLQLWSNVTELIGQSPLLGHGWRSLAYAHYSTEFSGPRFMEMLDNAHNLPLHLAVELGLPVAILFCGVVGWLIWKNKPWAETHSDRQLAWGMLMVIGIHSLVEYPLWYGPFFMTALIAIGILCADVWRGWLLAQTISVQRAVYWGVSSFAVVLLLGTSFVAFDYHRVSQIYLQPEERSNWYKADPLAAAKKSVLFQSHAKFAELQITPLSRETAPRILELSSELVMWSPEPRIIEKLIESAVMMGLDDVAAFHLKRYKVAYPQAYALWSERKL